MTRWTGALDGSTPTMSRVDMSDHEVSLEILAQAS